MNLKDLKNTVIQNKNNIGKVKNIFVRSLSIDFSKNIRNLDSEWYTGEVDLTISLKKFPEEYPDCLKINCIFKPINDGALVGSYLTEIPAWNYIVNSLSDTNYELIVNVAELTDSFAKIKVDIINPNESNELRKPKS